MRDETKELIIHAAVKAADCDLIIFGKCHADCFAKAHHLDLPLSKKAEDQGFLTNRNKFLNRRNAAILAFKNGQIKKETSILFSEDIWCSEHGGEYKYCEIEGYYK